jgi:hypothetical protein
MASLTSLPGLNLSLKKKKSTQVNSTSTATNTNVINIFPSESRQPTPAPQKEIELPPVLLPASIVKTPKPAFMPGEQRPQKVEPSFEAAEPTQSPKDSVSIEFMKALIGMQNELLLDNINLINNLKELGNKIIYRVKHLKEMIEILMGVSEENVSIYLEERPSTNICNCCEVKLPLYSKIKSITLNRTTNFITTDIATRLQEEFRISLEFALDF